MQIFDTFISYRRSDTLAEVQNIYHALLNEGISTFCDIYSLNSGRFDENLKFMLDNCSNYILVLKANSLDRCEDPEDWLRLEIEEALKKEKNIICVFIGDFQFPQRLPKEIDKIRFYNGVEYNYRYFQSFIDCLISRFLVHEDLVKNSNESRDFVICDGKLIKYVGLAAVVTIPNGVVSIGREAFKDQTQITDVHFNEGVEEIEDGGFERCINITHVTLPNGLKKIGKKAFSRCYNLAFVAFNDGLEWIDEEAFTFCEKLRMVKLGCQLRLISSSAFNNCDRLSSIFVDEENGSYVSEDGILYDKSMSCLIRCPEGYVNDLVVVPSSVRVLSEWCFSRCTNLVDVILPRGLKRVEKYAFNECFKILSLTLNDEIEEFDESALNGWTQCQRVVAGKKFSPLLRYTIERKLQSQIEKDCKDSLDGVTSFVVIKTTYESREEAANMARQLLSRHYIASAQLHGLNAFYTWNGELCNEDEIELSCITSGAMMDTVCEFIKEHHSYECCQIVCIPILKTSVEFEEWLKVQLRVD